MKKTEDGLSYFKYLFIMCQYRIITIMIDFCLPLKLVSATIYHCFQKKKHIAFLNVHILYLYYNSMN